MDLTESDSKLKSRSCRFSEEDADIMAILGQYWNCDPLTTPRIALRLAYEQCNPENNPNLLEAMHRVKVFCVTQEVTKNLGVPQRNGNVVHRAKKQAVRA